MTNHSSILRSATGIAVATLLGQSLAGCSGASTALPAAAPASMAAPASIGTQATDRGMNTIAQPDKKKKAGSELLFVADNEKSRILVYNAAEKNSNPIRTITSGIGQPNGIAVDESGNLWVANLAGNDVTEYAANASSPELTLSSGLNQPYDVKVDGFGDVFVANDATGGSNTNYISEFIPHVSIPVGTWPISQGQTLSGIALANPTTGSETIYGLEYGGNPDYGYTGTLLKCPTLGSQLVCTPQNGTFGETGGIAVAQSPIGSTPLTLLAVDQYVPGYDIITVGHSTTQVSTGGTPEFITLNSTGKDVFVSDRFYGRVDEYSYPAGKLVTTFPSSGAQLYGVAVSPSGSYH
jgi:hypothetical protein